MLRVFQCRSKSVSGTRAVLLVSAVCVLSACVATTPLKRSDPPAPPTAGVRVLLMAPDVQLSEVTAAGLQEPNARWTEQGRRNVSAALSQLVASRQAVSVPYREPQQGSSSVHSHLQLLKLHEAVGGTILVHKYNQAMALPTKAQRFDWTLGPGASVLAEEYDADYALFVFLHDSYASGERVAMMVAMAAFGVGLQGGIQRGFASLVNLRSGDIVWFNVLVRGSGDLRTPEAAKEAVAALLLDVPL